MLVKIAGMYNSLKCNSLPKGKRHHRGMPDGCGSVNSRSYRNNLTYYPRAISVSYTPAFLIKYVVCYFTEKQHRYVFDNLYLQDYKSNTLYQSIKLILYKILCRIVPDFREYLNHWHKSKKDDYLRYKTY